MPAHLQAKVNSQKMAKYTAVETNASDKRITASFNLILQSGQFSATPAPPPTQYPAPLPRMVVSEEDMDALLLEFSQLL
jgi:hypothetical protein